MSAGSAHRYEIVTTHRNAALSGVERDKLPVEWHILTGEYPPDPGGVADYTAVLAQALADAGHAVRIWCPGDPAGSKVERDGLTVHRVAGCFGPDGLTRLDRELDRFSGPLSILIQYSPPAFGWRAMNLPFAAWVLSRRIRRGDDIRVMFHEVAFPWVRRPLRYNLLAAVNRVMAALLLRACSQAYVSIPGWLPHLSQLGSGRLPIAWLPIPSNVPSNISEEDVERRRIELAGQTPLAPVVGHFGTYGTLISRYLEIIFHEILVRRTEVKILLLGSGGDRWRKELITDHPEWGDRVVATGPLPADSVAQYLCVCDLVVQPYPDGVSSRRTTVMAALANGVPVVTTIGFLSEPLWSDGVVASVDIGNVGMIGEVAIELLDSPDRRAKLGRAGLRLYEDRFAIGHTLEALINQRKSH